MHDDRLLVEGRIARILRERLRPAIHGERAPLSVAVWHVPGEPVPAAEALAAAYVPAAVGQDVGPGLGDQLVPRHRHGARRRGPGRPVEALVDLGFGGHARVLGRGPRPPAGRHGGQGPQPATRRAVAGSLRAASTSTSTSRRPPTRTIGYGTDQGDRLTAGAGPALPACGPSSSRSSTRACSSWTVTSTCLGARCTSSRSTARGAGSCCGRWSGPSTSRWTGPTCPARPRPPARSSPTRCRRRRRPARTGSARSATRTSTRRGCGRCARPSARSPARSSNVADLMDDDPGFVFAMSSAQQWAWIKEHRPEVWERIEGQGRVRAVRARRRDVGRVRHEHAGRRGAGPPARARQAVLLRRSSASRPRRSGCPTRSATPRRCRSS